MIRATTTLADPCTGAPRRDFLLGLRHGQLAGAHVPSWCSWHGWTLVAPNELARLASLQRVPTRHLEGTGERLTCRTAIGVARCIVDKGVLAEAPVRHGI